MHTNDRTYKDHIENIDVRHLVLLDAPGRPVELGNSKSSRPLAETAAIRLQITFRASSHANFAFVSAVRKGINVMK
jgi:hypothetical protein